MPGSALMPGCWPLEVIRAPFPRPIVADVVAGTRDPVPPLVEVGLVPGRADVPAGPDAGLDGLAVLLGVDPGPEETWLGGALLPGVGAGGLDPVVADAEDCGEDPPPGVGTTLSGGAAVRTSVSSRLPPDPIPPKTISVPAEGSPAEAAAARGLTAPLATSGLQVAPVKVHRSVKGPEPLLPPSSRSPPMAPADPHPAS